jgi:hypothetical protein
MKTKSLMALSAAVLLCGVTGASAAGLWHWHSLWHSSSHSTMGRAASGTLNLTSAQQRMAWKDLSTEASKQNLPSGFNATTGSVVPSTFKIEPVPSKAARDVPALAPYDFATAQGKVLIVNPSDKKIVDVITG